MYRACWVTTAAVKSSTLVARCARRPVSTRRNPHHNVISRDISERLLVISGGQMIGMCNMMCNSGFQVAICTKIDEFCIKNDGFCTKIDEFCI